MTRRRAVRTALTLLVTGLCVTYLLWKLDIHRTVHVLLNASLGWFLASVAIQALGVPPMAWRWQRLLRARGVHESLPWLNRAYFVSYTAGQVLPTAVGGDASRIYETSPRPPGRVGDMTAIALLERASRAFYEGVHAFRGHTRLLVGVLALTLVVQAYRVLAIWMAGRAVGVDLSPRPYYVMGPLLFLVMLVPFTINGLAVREAFFVSFLTQLGVEKELAFATGFLFFVVTIVLAIPGAVIVAVENLRRASSRAPAQTQPD